jgi:tRNA 2-selenouridine synthase
MKPIKEVYNQDYTFVDVRSPKEFEEDHIPGAVNIPLFSNEERSIVGTIYKKESKDLAIEKGLEIMSDKLPAMIKEYKKIEGKVCIYCWRGGMRSGSITSLLKSLKFDVIKLKDGYKDYRRFVREELDKIKIPKFIVIYGLTGSGKTDLLKQLPNSLDLEGLAEHRGSIFGDINLIPNSQKRFESLLLKRLLELQKEKVIYVEGESRRIGRILIHPTVWEHMQKAEKYKLICPDEERIERIHREYCHNIDKELFKTKILKIQKFLGKKKAEELIQLLEEDKIKKVIEIILLEYYDKLYAHTIESKTYTKTISSLSDLA